MKGQRTDDMTSPILFLVTLAVFSSPNFACGEIGVETANTFPRFLARTVRDTPEMTEPLKDCVCVLYYNCNNDFTINTHGEMLIDIRVKGPCEHYLEVCCKKKGVIESPGSSGHGGNEATGGSTAGSEDHQGTGSIGGSGESGGTGSIGGCGSTGGFGSTTCAPYPEPTPPSTGTGTQDRYKSRGCGYRNEQGVGFRIIGSKNEAQFGEFPWMVALLGKDDKYLCGGSLIHPRVVLTAAHCVRGNLIGNIIVRAGEWDRGTNKEVLPHQDRKISEVIEHEHFHSGALLNDVALLILSKEVEIIDNVDVICLPPPDYKFDYAPCIASGWGKGQFDATKNDQVILKKVQLPVVPRDQCEKALRETRLGQYFELHESFICAGGEKGQDTCKGDGGSPLMCPNQSAPGRYHQAGIVAWGIGCGDKTPGVYVNIPHFRKWIDANLARRGIFISDS